MEPALLTREGTLVRIKTGSATFEAPFSAELEKLFDGRTALGFIITVGLNNQITLHKNVSPQCLNNG